MKKLLACSAIALSVALGSCGTTGTSPTATTVLSNIAAFVKAVDARAIQLCSFLPAAGLVESIINANVPGLTTFEAIAQAICAGLKAAPLASHRLGGRLGTPLVHYVPGTNIEIHGRFVK